MLLARPCPGCRRHSGYPCGSCADELEPAGRWRAGQARSAVGLVAYDGVARPLVLEAKRPYGRSMMRWWSAGLAAVCPDEIDIVTWMPASRSGRAERGHDHGRLLARETARLLGRRHRRLLRRTDAATQRSRGRADRLAAVGVRVVASVEGQRVLVVDDVATTGASSRAAVVALLDAGARSVDVRVLAVVDW